MQTHSTKSPSCCLFKTTLVLCLASALGCLQARTLVFEGGNEKIVVGNSSVVVRSQTGDAFGAKLLTNEKMSPQDLNVSSKSKFKLEVAATSGQAVGMLVGGLDNHKENNGKVVFNADKGVTILSSDKSSKFASRGIEFSVVGNSGAHVWLKDKSFIKAEDALYLMVDQDVAMLEVSSSAVGHPDVINMEDFKFSDHSGAVRYLITNTGDLTIEGRVSNYKGGFNQRAGSTVLRTPDKKFFSGLTIISGGKMDFDGELVYQPNDGLLYPVHLMLGGELTLRGIKVADHEEPRKFLLLVSNGGTLNVKGDVRIGVGGDFGFNAGTLNIVNGQSLINGRIEVSKVTISETNAQIIVDGGSFEVGESGVVHVDKLKLQNKALFKDAGMFRANSIELGSGSSFSDQHYESIGNPVYVFGGPSSMFTLSGGVPVMQDGITEHSMWRIPEAVNLDVIAGTYEKKYLQVDVDGAMLITNASMSLQTLSLGGQVTIGANGVLDVKRVLQSGWENTLRVKKGGCITLEDPIVDARIFIEKGANVALATGTNKDIKNANPSTDVFIGQPVKLVNRSGIFVGKGEPPFIMPGHVVIQKGSRLALDLSMAQESPMLLAQAFTIEDGTEIILSVKEGGIYRLFDVIDEDKKGLPNLAKIVLKSGNPEWILTLNSDGTVTANRKNVPVASKP